jgi:hypothetical protein
MRGRWISIGLLCGAVVLLLSVSASGQSITINNNLLFGNTFPGIPNTVTKYTAGAAAEFLITGVAGSEISIDFTLPTYMSQGGFNMQMIFTENDCSFDARATPSQSAPENDNQDPWVTLYDRLGSNGLTIWLGGTIVPKLYQRSGAYSASIVLTVAYTGS